MFQKIKVHDKKLLYSYYYILLLRNNLQANNISELCNRCYGQTNSTTFTEIPKRLQQKVGKILLLVDAIGFHRNTTM